MKKSAVFGTIISALLLVSCATSFLNQVDKDQLKTNDEFENKVKIVEGSVSSEKKATPEASLEEKKPVEASEQAVQKTSEKGRKDKSKKKAKKSDKQNQKTAERLKMTGGESVTISRRQPELEDDEGFKGRRPLVDPFRVGEEVVHDVNYFKVSAGELRFKVDPFVTVNDRKSYAFKLAIKTSPLFSNFYSVDDFVDIFMDYEKLVPSVYQLHVRESKQVREAKMLFNDQDNTATFWEKKITQKDGVEEKRQHWELMPYSQNVYSVIFYMRFFKWDIGKEYSFRIGHDKDNLVFSGKALRKEILETKLGPMKAIVIAPKIVLKGKFQPIGENFIWLSDDEHRYILRIEAKIKIGTLISEVTQIRPNN